MPVSVMIILFVKGCSGEPARSFPVLTQMILAVRVETGRLRSKLSLPLMVSQSILIKFFKKILRKIFEKISEMFEKNIYFK